MKNDHFFQNKIPCRRVCVARKVSVGAWVCVSVYYANNNLCKQ